MSKEINSVDFWVEELIHETRPEYFDFHENFVPYMRDKKMGSFGSWMWNSGYNAGLVNLQAKVNTYCVPQWISIKDRLPDEDTWVLAYIKYPSPVFEFERGIRKTSNIKKVFYDGESFYCDFGEITHWMPLPSTEGLNEA